MISALISWRQSIARTGSEPEGELADRRVVTLDGAELGCLGRLLSCRVIDNDSPLFLRGHDAQLNWESV